MGILLIALPNAFAQTKINSTNTISSTAAVNAGQGLTLSILGYSPDFGTSVEGYHCIAHEMTNHWIEAAGITEKYKAEEIADAQMASEMLGGERATYNLPVIFHVIHNLDNPAENVSQADIYSLLDEVNLDFSATNPDVGLAHFGFVPVDADIQFCLAKYDESGTPLTEYGINRVETTEDFYDPSTETNKMKSSTGGDTGTEPWDRDQYINIWICDITNGAGSGTAGYAYKPTVGSLPPASIDGIVIDYNIGTDNDVLSHELGHFLGLSHTWGNSNTETDCTEDDGLADTPQTKGPSFNYAGSCSGSQQVCTGIETQYENFMDYSSCQLMFTTDQANLMAAVLGGSRAPLTTSATCTPLFPVPPVAEFVADITITIEGGSVNFTDLSTNWPISWAWTTTPSAGVTFIGGTSATSQDPTIQFTVAGFYDIALTATNAEGTDTETKTAYIEVIASGGGAIDCDTLRNYTATEAGNMTYYGLTGEEGYYPSIATISGGMMYNYAEIYNATSPTNLRRVRFPVVQADDIGAASNVTFTVWSDAGGLPGFVMATEVVAISSLNVGFWNEIDFIPEVPVSGNFWAGWQMDPGSFDTLLMTTTNFADRPVGPNSTSAAYVGAPFNSWYLTTDIFISTPDAALIFDALVSNGPAPVANVSFPVTETCDGMPVTMNGFGSLNTSDYYWDIYHNTTSTAYFFDQANLTTTFTEGDWDIFLVADGSCLSDVSPTFNLIVNPALAGSPAVTNEVCVASDGQLDFAPITGGSGTGMQYSINDGATFFPTALFTGLNTGDYNWVIEDDANCELLGTTTVGNDNPFAPTITPDQMILAGTPTDLTVTGGVSWLWYEGALEIGSTATINVAPVVTTTYYCSVTDGSGCTADLEVTLTMDPAGITDIGLETGITIYPNPANGQFSLTFNLNKEADVTVEIVNILGDKVTKRLITNAKNQTVKFDMSTVADGVYFVVIETENQTISKKLVVRK